MRPTARLIRGYLMLLPLVFTVTLLMVVLWIGWGIDYAERMLTAMERAS